MILTDYINSSGFPYALIRFGIKLLVMLYFSGLLTFLYLLELVPILF